MLTLTLLGTVGIGLVWGWLAAWTAYGARWTATLFILIGLVAQGLLVPQVIAPDRLAWFLGAGALSFAVCLGWLHGMVRRRIGEETTR